MEIDSIFSPYLKHNLSHSFYKRETLDITNSTTDFSNNNIIFPGFAQSFHSIFNFISDMRYHLNCCTEEITSSLFCNYIKIDLSGSCIIGSGHIFVKESFIMSEIEIGFSSVIGNVNFTVLKWIHRSGIDINIWIKFLNCNRVAAKL